MSTVDGVPEGSPQKRAGKLRWLFSRRGAIILVTAAVPITALGMWAWGEVQDARDRAQ